MPAQIPVVDYLVLGDPPHLQAKVCSACGARYFDRRNGCARCGGREFTAATLANTGQVRSFTEVHRAAGSVPVPFISAVVALDDGAVVKANLIDVAREDIVAQLPVELTTFVAKVDDEGTEAVAFGYRHRSAVHASVIHPGLPL